MGLDQWIYRKVEKKPCPNCSDTHFTPDGQWCFECNEHGEEVAYFRKVNFLHRWVEQHCNDGIESNCDEIPIHLEALAGLEATCRRVLDNPALGPELLPTMGRFFFGSTEYDEWYINDVGSVHEALSEILATEMARHPSTLGQYVYVSSW